MSTFLKVPYIKQPKNSRKCGAACVSMLVRYYKKITIDINEAWMNIIDISPEDGSEYCKTHKIGKYLSENYFKTCVVKYNDLEKLLIFCNTNGIAPILNHNSFENQQYGHFTIVKKINGDRIGINDPENRKRRRVLLSELVSLSIMKKGDEIGGELAIIPIFDKFPTSKIKCSNCNSDIDTSLSKAVNIKNKIVESYLCLQCDIIN